MALAMGLALAPLAEAAASVAGMETLATAKKKTVKKTTKKTKTTTTAKKATTATESTAKTAATTSTSNSGSLLGGIISAIGRENKGGSILSGLSTIFDATKGATKDRIVGSWTYTEPAGIKKGMMTMTFDKDGKFTQVIGKRATAGTYTISNHNVVLNYGGKVKQIVGTTQLDGNDLLIVMDASKLLKYANVLGALTGNSALKSIGSAVSSLDGMEIGLKLNK